MKEKSGLRPRSLKNIEKAGQRMQKSCTGGPQGGPRVGQGLQNEVQIVPKFMEKRGSGPSLHPKGARGASGAPKSSKINENFDIFVEQIGSTVAKKRRAFRHVFFNMFVVGKSKAKYKKNSTQKGEHSVLFFTYFW